MSIDYGEKERQFLEALKADTGRTLEEWMAAIEAQGLTRRNDIIDWLRRQNFMFSKASWLERIHNNGGKPIYSGGGTPRTQTRPRTQAATPRLRPLTPPAPAPTPAPPVLRIVPNPAPPPAAPPVAAPATAPSPPPSWGRPGGGDSRTAAGGPPPTPSPSPQEAGERPDPAALDALLARAKGLRPLATYLIAEIRKAAPGVAVFPRDGYVGLRSGDRDVALIAISAKELRLGLTLKTKPQDAALVAAKLPALAAAPPMTHMAVLNDARQITPSLLAAVAEAAADAR